MLPELGSVEIALRIFNAYPTEMSAASGARLPAGAGAAGGGDCGASGVRCGCYSAFEIGPHRRFYGYRAYSCVNTR